MIEQLTLNWWAIIAASVAGMLLGAAWYSPLLFGNKWLAAIGKTEEELTSPAPAMVGSLVCTLLSAIAIAVLVSGLGIQGIVGGAVTGGFFGFTLVATAMLSDSLFCGWGWPLYFMQAGYRVMYLIIMGAIIGGWPV